MSDTTILKNEPTPVQKTSLLPTNFPSVISFFLTNIHFVILQQSSIISLFPTIFLLSSYNCHLSSAYRLLASFILILRPLYDLPSTALIIWLATDRSISTQLFISFMSILPSTSFLRSLMSRINCRKLAL